MVIVIEAPVEEIGNDDGKFECTECKIRIGPEHRSLKNHCVRFHMSDKIRAIRCRSCHYAEPWFPALMGMHTLVFHGEEETDFIDDRESHQTEATEVMNRCFPKFQVPPVVPVTAPRLFVLKRNSTASERLSPKCRLCGLPTRHLPQEKRMYHAIIKHQNRPGFACNRCSFTASRSMRQIRDHMRVQHPRETDDFQDNRDANNTRIYRKCFTIVVDNIENKINSSTEATAETS